MGHYMNHDFPFFFSYVNHPEVERFCNTVTEYIQKQIQLRQEREQTEVSPTQLEQASTALDPGSAKSCVVSCYNVNGASTMASSAQKLKMKERVDEERAQDLFEVR